MKEPRKEVIVRTKRDRLIPQNKILYIVLGVILFYMLTSAHVESEITREERIISEPIQEKVIVEKTVTVQEPYEEKVPISREGCDYYPYEWESLPEDTKLLKGDSFANEETGNNYIRCNITVINLEKKAGEFTFYSRGCCDQTREIPAEGSVSFQWEHKVEPGDTFCQIEVIQSKIPKIHKCLETADTIYKLTIRYREVIKKQNVTEYRDTGEYVEVERIINATKYTYTNKVFGYKQFFYLGY